MKKSDRAQQIYNELIANGSSRKEIIEAFIAQLQVKPGGASVYYHNCKHAQNEVTVAAKKPIEKATKRVAEPDKTNVNDYPKLDPVEEGIPDCVPDFLLSEAQRKLRASAKK